MSWLNGKVFTNEFSAKHKRIIQIKFYLIDYYYLQDEKVVSSSGSQLVVVSRYTANLESSSDTGGAEGGKPGGIEEAGLGGVEGVKLAVSRGENGG